MTANRVLCVEDDADTRAFLKAKLGFSDFEAVVAPDTDAALRLMERERFSLYVLDGGLRGAKGPSLCERIRAADALTPIVIFSGHAFASDHRGGDARRGERLPRQAGLLRVDPHDHALAGSRRGVESEADE